MNESTIIIILCFASGATIGVCAMMVGYKLGRDKSDKARERLLTKIHLNNQYGKYPTLDKKD